jgi:hypothetical protein
MKGTGFFKAGAILLIVTACLHTVGLVQEPVAENETERTMLSLMSSYQMDLMGKKVTIMDLYTFFSLNFTILTLVIGVFDLWILKQNVGSAFLKKIMMGNVLIWALYLIPLFVWTFLLPQLCIALAAGCFILALNWSRGAET